MNSWTSFQQKFLKLELDLKRETQESNRRRSVDTTATGTANGVQTPPQTSNQAGHSSPRPSFLPSAGRYSLGKGAVGRVFANTFSRQPAQPTTTLTPPPNLNNNSSNGSSTPPPLNLFNHNPTVNAQCLSPRPRPKAYKDANGPSNVSHEEPSSSRTSRDQLTLQFPPMATRRTSMTMNNGMPNAVTPSSSAATVPIGAGFGGPGRPDQSPSRRPQQPLVFQSRGLSPAHNHGAPAGNQVPFCEQFKRNNILVFDGKEYFCSESDLEYIAELGSGSCGQVNKMKHTPSHSIVAVKQMRRSGDEAESKRIAMDLGTLTECSACPYIVKCYGYLIKDTEVLICMELMATCFEKLSKRMKLKRKFPEDIIGKVAVATVQALHFLKERHSVIHRDVKPSNILINENGDVKLCDFGISGHLVDSKAKTRQAGCAAYMAPERIDPPNPSKPLYDIRADVWSLGITLHELAMGEFPYKGCSTDFEVLARVINDPAPSLPENEGFSEEFRSFVKDCLTYDYKKRPKYKTLLEHPFIRRYQETDVDVAAWFADVNKTLSPAEVEMLP